MGYHGSPVMQLIWCHAIFFHFDQHTSDICEAVVCSVGLDEAGVCSHDWRQPSSFGILDHLLNGLMQIWHIDGADSMIKKTK